MATVIPILTLGRHREIAQSVAKVLQPHGFSVNGILSLENYSSTDLALALRVLEPRPQALLIGGYTDEEAEQGRTVFDEYMKETGVSGGTVVKVGPGVLDKLGREGVGNWVKEQLEGHFRK